MVAPITLNVRHIRGHTFTVEVDHDAETLGLKVIIWEAEHIAIDQQRLVFAGKELEDGGKLSDMGISDGAQIFLVESGDAGDVAAQVSVSGVQPSAVVPPAFAPESDAAVISAVAIPSQSGSFAVNMPAPHSRYELVSDDQASLERINAAMCLAKYVRIYCIFGFILSLLSAAFCAVWAAVVALMYLLGWIGTCKLNRCLLVFPMILTFLFGFGGVALKIYEAVVWGSEMGDYEYVWLIWTFCLFVAFLHVMIFLSIGKLCCRIGRLSCDEWANARAKIRTRGCCC